MTKELTPSDWLFAINFYFLDLKNRIKSNDYFAERGDMVLSYTLFRAEFEELDALLYVAEMLDMSTWVRKHQEAFFSEISDLQDKYGFFYIDAENYGKQDEYFRDIQLEDMSEPMDDSYYDKLADELHYDGVNTNVSYVVWKLSQMVGLDFDE